MATPRKRPPIDAERLKKLQEQLKNIEAREKQPLKWHWSLTFTIFGGIAGVITTGIITHFTMISYTMIGLIVLLAGLIAFILQWRIFYSPAFIQKHFRISLPIYSLYNFGGIGFTFAALFFMLNWLGAGEKEVERHRILGVDRNYIVDANYLVVLLLEDDAYEDEPQYRAVRYADGMRNKSFPFLDIEIAPGLFGFNIYYGHYVSPDLKKTDKEK